MVDSEMGDPARFSTGSIIGSEEGRTSDQDGEFKIEVELGDSFEERSTGFIPKRLAVEEIDGSFLEIVLTPAISQLDEFNIVEADERALNYIKQVKWLWGHGLRREFSLMD